MDQLFSPINLSQDDLQLGENVKYLAASYVDMHGVSKAKMVPISHAQSMLDGSELFTGAAVDGVPQDVNDEEVSAQPDVTGKIELPWDDRVAWFPSNLFCKGVPFEACSRNILDRVTKSANEAGYKMNLGIEAEFFVFDRQAGTTGLEPLGDLPHLQKPCYDLTRLSQNTEWLFELVEAMNQMGWDVYSFDHEDGIGQFEIDFEYSDAIRTADRYVFFRWMANEIASKHGAYACFMPKPFSDRTGSAAHFNMSLADAKSGENLFNDPKDKHSLNLSAIGYNFIAGVLRHLPAICALSAPTVNSYKRLLVGGSNSGFTWAPVFSCYGNNNRTNTLRIPKSGGRVEMRLPDSACNPYLAAALTLAAGLEGIRENLDPGEPFLDNMYTKTPEELTALNVKRLPSTLQEAVDELEADPLARSVLGPAMHDSWIAFKRDEWASYTNHVSEWETERYLRFFG